jgi:hypothetical protein
MWQLSKVHVGNRPDTIAIVIDVFSCIVEFRSSKSNKLYQQGELLSKHPLNSHIAHPHLLAHIALSTIAIQPAAHTILSMQDQHNKRSFTINHGQKIKSLDHGRIQRHDIIISKTPISDDHSHPSIKMSSLRGDSAVAHKQEHPRDVDDCAQTTGQSYQNVKPLASHVIAQNASVEASGDDEAPNQGDDEAQMTTSTIETLSSQTLPSATPVSISSSATPIIKADAHDANSSASVHRVSHSKALATGLLSALLLILLLLITAIILTFRRRRRSRRQELCQVLDKVTTPPPRPDRSRFSSISFDAVHNGITSKCSFAQSRAPTVEIPVVPTLDIQQLHDHNIDLEANGRHSAELSQQKVVGQRVRSDMSFSWQFPKLSVPPAAARALQSAHYVKKRSTIPSPPSSSSMCNEQGSPSLSLSSAAELAFGTLFAGAPSVKPASHETSMTISNSSQSAAPSSSCVDPVMDVVSGSLDASPSASSTRTRWWSSSLHGFRQPRQSDVRSTSAPTISSLSGLSWHTQPAISPNPIVLATHDPVLQDVMAHVLSLVAGHDHSLPSDVTASEKSRMDDAPLSFSRHISSGQRRASRAPSMLEPCRESSEERLNVGPDVEGDRSDDAQPDSPTHSIIVNTPPPKARSLSEAYSAYSIIVHDTSDETNSQDLRVSHVQTPNARQSRRSMTPKIMLTSTAEDGSHERQLSMTSFETSTSSSISNGGESGSSASESDDDSMEFAYADHSMIRTACSRPHDDVAHAIGEAFMAHMSTERRIAKKYMHSPSTSTIARPRRHRDSDSTIDSLSTHSHHRQAVLTRSESFEGAFNDAVSEAASARSSGSSDRLTDDRDEDGSDASTISFDEKSIVTARPDSMTTSESGFACLIEDDFPTIPTWKSISTQKSFATTEETATMGWRSASSMSIATIRQPM